MIDLYHKRVNGNKNKLDVQIKRNKILEKINEKYHKIYFLPRGKIEKYNIISIEKMIKEEKRKKFRGKRKINIFDFLYDVNNEKYTTKYNNTIK